MVYVTKESRRAQTMQALHELFRDVPGIVKTILPADYAQYGYPQVQDQGRMSDMVLAAAPDYAFDGNARGDAAATVPEPRRSERTAI